MNVKLRKDMMIVVLKEKVFIFNFVTLKLIEQVETFDNPEGLCAISTAEKPISKIICIPGTDKGSLKVLNYGKSILNMNYIFYKKSSTKALISSSLPTTQKLDHWLLIQMELLLPQLQTEVT